MHEENIESIRREAIRLAEFQANLMEEMDNELNLISQSEEDQKKSPDKKVDVAQKKEGSHISGETKNQPNPKIGLLRSEVTKLKSLEMVLAIVGTMKAGKSTTINAIVGMEVLPSRNEPMTTLPTFIRHKPGQLEPRLILEDSAQLQKLADDILEKTRELPPAENKLNDRGFSRLLNTLESNNTIEKEYIGADRIFHFLTTINDMVRFGADLGVEFSLTEHTEINQLPAIEVEFSHLHGLQGDQGTLTLLDTPGPNEAGQMGLQKVLIDQLKRASAVLSVMDYTQLKSEADAYVRQELNDISDVVDDRLFVLVNKFDQRGSNDMDKDQVRSYVASSMMKEDDFKERIFPVSSRRAYLANRARRTLTAQGYLPDPQQEGWASDFYKSFKPMWEPDEPIEEDAEELQGTADKLWTKSGFDAPLNAVIRKAHSESALLLLHSTAKKLIAGATEIYNTLDLREGGLKKNAKDLEDAIAQVSNDIKKTEEAEKTTEKKCTDLLLSIRRNLDKLFKDAEKSVLGQLNDYFKTGKKSAIDAADTKNLSREKNKSSKRVNTSNRSRDVQDFDPDIRRLEFEERSEARKQEKIIKDSISQIINGMNASIQEKIDSDLSEFEEDFKKSISSDAQEILDNFMERLGKDGFNIEMDLPKEDLKFDFDAKLLIQSVNSIDGTKEVSRLRAKSGMLSRFSRWAGEKVDFFYENQWGYEQTTESIPVTVIDFDKISSRLKADFKESIPSYSKGIIADIEKRLNGKKDKFFESFKHQISEVRGELMRSQIDKSRSKEEQEQLLASFRNLKKKARHCKEQGEALSAEVKDLEKV